MTAADVVIVAVGMVTPVGLTLAEVATAVRARTSRFTESPFHDRRSDPIIMAAVPEDALPALAPAIDAQPKVSSRERRMLRLAAQAFVQCAAGLPKSAGAVPVSIAVPAVAGSVGLDRRRFVDRLAIQTGIPIAIEVSDAQYAGRAGGLLALTHARDLLLRGAARYAIAGGVDSYRDAAVLGRLDAARRLKSSLNRDALIPGEGAALLLLTTRGQAAQDGLDPLATFSSAATAFEDGHLLSTAPYKADALAVAIGTLAARRELTSPVAEVYSSMTGEHHWGREWAVAFMRQRALFAPEHGFHHPADCYGDIGTAAGPAMVGLSALGQRKQYRRSPALVYCSSDDGPRAALFVHQGA
jgi:3-oxoacyl-[acyl-carrier-protein] synthase I